MISVFFFFVGKLPRALLNKSVRRASCQQATGQEARDIVNPTFGYVNRASLLGTYMSGTVG